MAAKSNPNRSPKIVLEAVTDASLGRDASSTALEMVGPSEV
jgi:hypothetical protein